MKKFLLIAVVIVAGLSSCKKDYTCECTTSVSGSDDISASTTINASKKDAEEACENGTSSVGGVSVTCEIK